MTFFFTHSGIIPPPEKSTNSKGLIYIPTNSTGLSFLVAQGDIITPCTLE